MAANSGARPIDRRRSGRLCRSSRNAGGVVVAVDDGEHQSAGPIRIGNLYIGAVIQQDLRAFGESAARREQQRGKAAAREMHGHVARLGLHAAEIEDGRNGIHVGAMIHQHLHHVRMIFGGGPHQSGLPAPALLGVHFSAMIQQRFHGVRVARARRRHQCRLAFGLEGIRVGTRLQQHLHHPRRCHWCRPAKAPVNPSRLEALTFAPAASSAFTAFSSFQ